MKYHDGSSLTLLWLYKLGTLHPLPSLDAFILSVSGDMVGRGFFFQDMTLSDPYTDGAVLKGTIWVFMDVPLISNTAPRDAHRYSEQT